MLKGYDIVTEGKAKLAVPKYHGKVVSSEMPVFYNPVMKANRDLTLLVMVAASKLYRIKKWNIADIMAATGIRGIRILLEIGSGEIETVKMNDYSAAAIAAIKQNLKLNKIKSGGKVVVARTEANKFLLNNRSFNFIDVDPFGYPGTFLDAAVKKTAHNGILAVTATDTSALAGTAPAACRRKYLAVPLKNSFMHETGIRILIRLVQIIGAMHEKAMLPVFSYYKDHYIRAFFLCKTGAHRVDELLDVHGKILYCRGCCNKAVREGNAATACSNCGREMETAGPVWTGTLFDTKLVKKMVAAVAASKTTDGKIKEFLAIIAEEAKDEAKSGIGFYAVEDLCEKHKIGQQPKTSDVIIRLRHKGFAASRTHCSTTGIKTNATVKQAIKAVTRKRP